MAAPGSMTPTCAAGGARHGVGTDEEEWRPRSGSDPASAEEMLRSAHIAQVPAKIPLSRRTILQILHKNHCEDSALC
jgi:hypothetical protein